MAQTISKLFATPAHGIRAADALKNSGYVDVHVFPGTHSATGESKTDVDRAQPQPSVLKAMVNAYIYKPHAEIYADRKSVV